MSSGIRSRSAAALVGLAVLAGMLAGCDTGSVVDTAKTLCIGTDFPTSGTDGGQGTPAQNGADLAIDQVKLPAGYIVAVKHFDDAVNGLHNPAQGAANMLNMTSDTCVVAMIGPLNNDVAPAEMPIAANAGLAMISPTVTNPGLTKSQDAAMYGLDFTALHPTGKPNVFFRLPATDDVQGMVDAQLALQAGERRAYVVDDSEPYGRGLATFFAQALVAGGGTVVGQSSIDGNNAAQLGALVTKMQAALPGVVFYGGLTAGGGASLRASMTAGGLESVPMLGGDGIANDPTFLQVAGAAAAGTVATSPQPDVVALTGTAAQQFSQAYQSRFTGAPTAASVLAFDATSAVLAALSAIIATGQTPTRSNVLAEIAQNPYQGLTGSIAFDAHGDNIGSTILSVYEVRGSSWILLKQVSP